MAYVAAGYVAVGYVELAETPPLGYPSESDVRLGVVYGPNGEYVGSYTGTQVPTAADIAAAILAAAQITPIHGNMVQTNSVDLKGDGTETDKFRSALVP